MSRAWLGVVVSTLLLSLALDAATGQSQGPFFRIDAKDAPGKTITRDLGSEQLHFNVSVNPSQATPLSERFLIRLDVTMEPSNPPNGFSLSLAAADAPASACSDSRSCSVTTPPGQVVRFVVTVTNTVTDPDQPSVTVKLNYRSTPMFQGQPNELSPLSAPLVQQMSQTHQASAQGTVNLALDASERLASFVKENKWLVLGAAGAFFVLGVVLVRRRKGGLVVTTESPVQEVLPGRGASFPLQVTNEGQKQGLSLTTSEVPPGWSAILPVERIELGPGETTTIWLTLKAPQGAQPGQHVQVNFIASSQDGATAEALVEAAVVERYGARPPVGHAPEAPTRAAAASEEPQEEAPVPIAPRRRRR